MSFKYLYELHNNFDKGRKSVLDKDIQSERQSEARKGAKMVQQHHCCCYHQPSACITRNKATQIFE